MRVVLNFLKHLNRYVLRIPAHVIAGQVDEHHMLGVFLLISRKSIGYLGVFLIVSGAAECSGNWVYVCRPLLYEQLSFGRRPEEFDITIIIIEEVGRRIDGAEGSIHIEFVAVKGTRKSAREHYLKHISAETMLLPFLNDTQKLFVSQVRFFFSCTGEAIGCKQVTEDYLFDLFQTNARISIPLPVVLKQSQFIRKVIHHNDIPIDLVQDIRHRNILLCNVDILKVTYCVIGHIAKEPTVDVSRIRIRHSKRLAEFVEKSYGLSFFLQRFLPLFSVGKSHSHG